MNAPDSQPDMLDHDSAGVSKPVEAPRLVVRINSVAMKMVFPFIAVDDVRYYLCGANIRPLDDGGAMICATDGHRFIVVRDPNGFIEEEVIEDIEDLEEIDNLEESAEGAEADAESDHLDSENP